jgi:lycopene cyclase domain-containing protein
MKYYTLFSVLAVMGAVYFDQRSKTNLLARPIFYIFWAIIVGFKYFVNGALTKYIVMYNPTEFMGYRIGSIPVEDFLFGFAMVTVCLVIWEKSKKS